MYGVIVLESHSLSLVYNRSAMILHVPHSVLYFRFDISIISNKV